MEPTTSTDHRLSDSDLTVLVERAAQGSWDSQLGPASGIMWDEMPHASKNSYRESVLSIIFHGTKALHELGYRKPVIITTVEELNALPDGSVVRSDFGVIHEKRVEFDTDRVFWVCPGDTDEHTAGKITLPATVLSEPSA